MIAIVDYGVGNVQAFLNVYTRLNIAAVAAASVDQLAVADRIILPGVGHFDHAMGKLNESGLLPTLVEAVRTRAVPVLGVCVGMQMLAAGSDEGVLPGLDWIHGKVHRLADRAGSTEQPVPHMGWNDVDSRRGHPLFHGLESDARFYFLHSYYFACAVPEHEIASARYGERLTCAVGAANVYGVQFHPEKSHEFGGRLLKNFAEL